MLTTVLWISCAAAGTRWSAAAFGELGFNPGLKVGVEHHLPLPLGDRGRLWVGGGGSAAATLRPQSHWRTLASAEVFLGARVWGLDVEIRGGFGGGRTFLASPTYEVTDDDELRRVPLAGQWGWMPWSTLGVGSGLQKHPAWRWFLRAGPMLQTPYHDQSALFILTEIGVTHKFSMKSGS